MHAIFQVNIIHSTGKVIWQLYKNAKYTDSIQWETHGIVEESFQFKCQHWRNL